MVATRLFIGVALSLAAAALWSILGRMLWQERLEGPSGVARRRFATWWFALAAYNAVNALLAVAIAGGGLLRWALDAGLVTLAVLIVVMFWGLTSYMAYLVTGKPIALRVATWTYAVQLVALLAVVVAIDPQGASVRDWTIEFSYAHADFVAANAVFALVFLLPPLLASVAYLALWIRVRDPASRTRIAIVGGSIALWLVNALVLARTAPGSDVPQATLRSLQVVIALGPLVAHRPPAWLMRRSPPVAGEVTRPARGAEDVAREKAAMAARVLELV